LSFFKPANAIFVPGMYYIHGRRLVQTSTRDHRIGMTHLLGVLEVLKEGILVPGNALIDVGSGVREALALA
jgi:hypothetical protein